MNYLNFIQIEWAKLSRKANFVLLGIFLLSQAVTALLLVQSSNSKFEDAVPLIAQGFMSFPRISNVLFAVFVIINLGKEFTENTLKKNIIDGWTRINFWLGKINIIVLISLSIILIEQATLFGGLAASGHADQVGLLFSWHKVIADASLLLFAGILAMFLAVVTRNTAFSVLIYIFWGNLEQIASWLLKSSNLITFDVYPYLPLAAMKSLITSLSEISGLIALCGCVYLTFIILLPYFIIKSRDL